MTEDTRKLRRPAWFGIRDQQISWEYCTVFSYFEHLIPIQADHQIPRRGASITKTKTRFATQFGLQSVPVHDLSTTIDKHLRFECPLAESCVSCLAYRPCLVSSCVDKFGLGVGDIVDGACHNALVGTNTDRNNVVSIVPGKVSYVVECSRDSR